MTLIFPLTDMDYSDYLDAEIMASRMGILPSQFLEGRKTQGITYTDSVKRRQMKYNKSDKGKARLRRYAESEKGKENAHRKAERDRITGRNAEKCRRYRERKKLQKNFAETMQVV